MRKSAKRLPCWHAGLISGLLGIVLPASGACAGPERAIVQDGPLAECPVCKQEGDLACVRVVVDDDTPRADFDGKTYCFCSDACREVFLEHPQEYAAGAKPLPPGK